MKTLFKKRLTNLTERTLNKTLQEEADRYPKDALGWYSRTIAGHEHYKIMVGKPKKIK